MEESLSKLYQDLKNSHSDGIVIEYGDGSLYHRAVNEGFAQKGKAWAYGTGVAIMLSDLGKQYDTYDQFKNRNQKPEFNISNSIVGDNNSGIVQGRDFNSSMQPENKKVAEDEQQNTKATFWRSIPEWAKILGGIGAIAGLIKTIIGLRS